MSNNKYTMKISLNVLNHLGINLYSNVPAVISEVIANAWDADATRVDIVYNDDDKSITVSDNGMGMDLDDINKKFLYVGYQRREGAAPETPGGRQPMGRKGIGKLSLFSIADQIEVYSKQGDEAHALRMDARDIKKEIKAENPDKIKLYAPTSIAFNKELIQSETGTAIKIKGFGTKVTKNTIKGMKKRIARRFSVFSSQFKVRIDGEEIGFSDRGYFHKARFLFQYGEVDFSGECINMEKSENRSFAFDKNGNTTKDSQYKIKGWIGIAHHSYDLDDNEDESNQTNKDDNLNNIAIVVRGKVAQEDILHQFRMGGLITKYIYGEIRADFLDDDEEEDIATSSRQKIVEDAPRYLALKKFLDNELKYIWHQTNQLKQKNSLKNAVEFDPVIKEWYDNLGKDSKKAAGKLLGVIEQIDLGKDKEKKLTLYKNGILAFERMMLIDQLSLLDSANVENLEDMILLFRQVDDLEAAYYHQIVDERLKVISKLNDIVDSNQRERVIQEYIFDHLWLLDPAWERATSDAQLETTIQTTIDKQRAKESGKESEAGRIDIQYRKLSGSHVIIELKRSGRNLGKSELEGQILKYINAVRAKLNNANRSNELLEGICIVGKDLVGWEDLGAKKADIDSLRPYNIKVLTYSELIDNAYSAYSKFIEKKSKVGKLHALIQKIGNMDKPKSEEK